MFKHRDFKIEWSIIAADVYVLLSGWTSVIRSAVVAS